MYRYVLDNLVIAGHDADRAKFQTFGDVHGADQNYGRWYLRHGQSRTLKGRPALLTGPIEFGVGAYNDAKFMRCHQPDFHASSSQLWFSHNMANKGPR